MQAGEAGGGGGPAVSWPRGWGTPAVLPGPPIPAAGTADRWPPAAGPRGSAQLQELALSPPRGGPHAMSHCNGDGRAAKGPGYLGPT